MARRDPVRRVLRELERAVLRFHLRGHTVLAAVSGGLDSTVLADALASLRRRGRFTLVIAHVHHGLRAEADDDQAAVAALAQRLGAPFAAERVEPAALRKGTSSRDRPTLQEAARTLRYAALHRIADRLGAQRIATAHHANDQVETVLLRLLRGTGPDGLGGIPERSPDGRIVRPLLRVSRADLEGYAAARALSWREDPSNASPDYARNRLRSALPALARDFNPQLLRAIADLAEAQRRDCEWIRAEVEREAGARFTTEGPWLRIDAKDWGALPETLSRRLAREALTRAGSARHASRVHLERISRFLCDASPGRRIELPGGVELLCERAGFRLGPLSARSSGDGEIVC
ncbi:MAG: tRNA lysidine(34) synthetase TilS [Deltaproteobacteria bacterium]|nr:MAG: tRNA lysidine(34) synthetase TilS [Deltaproteobacteria bacterium]